MDRTYFRVILPPHLKDIEKYVSMYWCQRKMILTPKYLGQQGCVWYSCWRSGRSKALCILWRTPCRRKSRTKPSYSQLVAEEYLELKFQVNSKSSWRSGNCSDSHGGANNYNVKNLFSAMHDILFVVAKMVINRMCYKILEENWKNNRWYLYVSDGFMRTKTIWLLKI